MKKDNGGKKKMEMKMKKKKMTVDSLCYDGSFFTKQSLANTKTYQYAIRINDRIKSMSNR